GFGSEEKIVRHKFPLLAPSTHGVLRCLGWSAWANALAVTQGTMAAFAGAAIVGVALQVVP
ncbi:MAG: hypothetical protein KDH18_18630, partial [Rhodoferax sp.]|nr:hypothetical protein [Rhodoferax sp.]MCB2030514.1 hypothetical protein [Rhodoferax sp.]